jgi:hypothetical protein
MDICDNNLHVFNEFHLGDNLWSVIFFNSIRIYLESSSIYIHYYLHTSYIEQIQEFIDTSHIVLHPLNEKPSNAFNIWIGCSFDIIGNYMYKHMLHIFIAKHFEYVASVLYLVNPFMEEFVYTCDSLDSIYETVLPEFKSLDILIINGRPQSGQYVYNADYWSSYMNLLVSKYKCAITTTDANVKCACTAEHGYSVKTIAAISTHARYVIAVNTGPIVPLFNTRTMANIEHMFVFDNVTAYGGHPKITNVKSWDDIIKYLNK